MDPISAFSLAVNILTVVGQELAADAQHLKAHCEKFSVETATSSSSQQNAASSISSDDDATLCLLASEVKAIADDILENLLKLNKQRSFMRSIRQSIRHTLKEPEMKRKAERLKEMQHKILFSIIVSINSSVNTLTLKNDEALARLDGNTRSLIQTIRSDNQATRAKMDTQMASLHTNLTKNHGQMMDSASQRHKELLGAIRVGPAQLKAPEGENEATYKARVTKIILDMLWFSRINDRYEAIKPAYHRTFAWIFSAETQLKSSCSFLQWVEQGSGLYWMSGKAGTGKSTLMKFIADDECTETLLQHWSKGRRYITAKYWFWDQSPDPLQKSIDGLYRGLLYDVITKEVFLAPLLFPDQFIAGREWQGDFPTQNELRRAFNRLVSMEASPVLLVLLIDGLDEYRASEIDQLGFADSLKSASQSKHIKIIASSRPENAFETAFKDCDKLYLHELTYHDQTHFAEDNLHKHKRMPYLASLDGGKEDAHELVCSVVKKSEGIFVWLRLVVNSLVQELDACDTIKDLQHILTQFPRGLENLFLHMMGRIREDRRQRGFLGLLLAQRALRIPVTQSPTSRIITNPTNPPRIFRHKFAFTAICLDGAYTDLDRVIDSEAESLSDSAGKDMIRKVENRLRTWSAGLLELGPPCRSAPQWPSLCQGARYSDLEIRFMHRSVVDFLDLSSTRSDIISTMSSSAFDVDLSLMKGLLVKVKREVCLWGFGNSSALWDFVELVLRISRHVEDTHTDAVIAILTNLDRTLTSAFTEYKKKTIRGAVTLPLDWTEYFPWNRRQSLVATWIPSVETIRRVGFLSIAVESGLAIFTIKQLEATEKQLLVKTTKGVPLLSLACRPPPFSFVIPGIIRPEIIRTLLELGADPNQRYFDGCSLTPWERMLQTAIDLRVVSIKGGEQLSDVLTMLIESGADLSITTKVRQSKIPSVSLRHPRLAFEEKTSAGSHPPLAVDDVVRYAFHHGTWPSLLSEYADMPRTFKPFQNVDLLWGNLNHDQIEEEEDLVRIPPSINSVMKLAAAEKEAIKKIGNRLLELIQTKAAEGLDTDGQVQL